jgi:ketose-bisphosphate aldolase
MQKLKNVYSLNTLLSNAEKGGYAVGSFAPRCTPMIAAILRAGEQLRSPLLVQISQRELEWAEVSPAEFGAAFYEQVQSLGITVPVGLHLDHTWDMEVIQQAVAGGFTSVMIDASSKELEENIAISREVAEYAHARGVAVEAELGRIFSADAAETDSDEEMYTNPQEAQRFVRETGVDALAVSVGTAHGVYMVRQPRVDIERLKAIRALTPIHLVLHGGSGTPENLLQAAIHLPGGGVSKINIATDLELAMLPVLGLKKRIPNAELLRLPPDLLGQAVEAVQALVMDKMVHSVGSSNHA